MAPVDLVGFEILIVVGVSSSTSSNPLLALLLLASSTLEPLGSSTGLRSLRDGAMDLALVRNGESGMTSVSFGREVDEGGDDGGVGGNKAEGMDGAGERETRRMSIPSGSRPTMVREEASLPRWKYSIEDASEVEGGGEGEAGGVGKGALVVGKVQSGEKSDEDVSNVSAGRCGASVDAVKVDWSGELRRLGPPA